MITVNDILNYLKGEYPLETACDFDNVGLLVGNGDNCVPKAVVCLDCDINAVNYAKQIGANLIITHHPVIFDGLKTVLLGSVVYQLVRCDISVISMHTNLDIAADGVTVRLCEAIGLKNVQNFVAHDGFLIRAAKCDVSTADALALRIKSALGDLVRYVDSGKPIHRVLVCSGSGGSYLEDVVSGGYDALISADIKHNVFIDAANCGVTVFDAGHYATENVVIKPLCLKLSDVFADVDFVVFNNPKLKSV